MIVIDSPGGKLEARDIVSFETGGHPGKGRRAAWPFTPTTGSPTRGCSAAARRLAVRAGMSRAGALEALTLAGAEMLDLQDRIGSLEAGQGRRLRDPRRRPAERLLQVAETWVEGVKVFDRNDPQDQLYAVGGFGAGHDQSPYFCCFDDVITGAAGVSK